MENKNVNNCNFTPQPLISVISPVYNVAPYLRRCIESILNQDYGNIEIIMVDDGSTDESGKILDKYSDKIKVIHATNHGVSHARNLGVSLAKGEYCCFVDSDDFIEPTYLSDMQRLMVSENADLVCCKLTCGGFINESEKVHRYNQKKALHVLFAFNSFHGWPWNKMYKTSIIKQNNLCYPENIRYCEDEVFVLDYILHCEKVVWTDKVLYHYVCNPDSVNRKMVKEQKFNYACLDRLVADDICLVKVLALGDKKLLHTLKARHFVSSTITLDKFLSCKCSDKMVYKILVSNLRKNYISYISDPYYPIGKKSLIKQTLCMLSPKLLYWLLVSIGKK